MTITKTGKKKHVGNRVQLTNRQLQKLGKFQNLIPKIKLHLHKAPIRPIMEYLILPTCATAKSNILKMKRIQNKAIKMIAANHPDRLKVNNANNNNNDNNN